MTERFSARDVADLVVQTLKPLLEDIAKRMPEEGELAAINKGVGATLELEAANALKLERIETTVRNLADNQLTLTEEVRGYHTRTIDQYDKLGTRVHKLEDWRDEHEAQHDQTTLTAEGDG